MSTYIRAWLDYAIGVAIWACTLGWLVFDVAPLGNIVKFHAVFLSFLCALILVGSMVCVKGFKAPVCGKFKHTFTLIFRTSRLLMLVWYGQFIYAALVIFCVFVSEVVLRETGANDVDEVV